MLKIDKLQLKPVAMDGSCNPFEFVYHWWWQLQEFQFDLNRFRKLMQLIQEQSSFYNQKLWSCNGWRVKNG